MLIRQGVFPGYVRQQGAAEVGDVFAGRQLRIDLDVIDDCVLRILITHALHSLLELLRILRRPPILQISLTIELPSFVIECVRQLVADR